MATRKRKQDVATVSITPAQIRRLLRPRVGFDLFVEDFARLYRGNPDELYVKGVDPEGILVMLEEYHALKLAERTAQRAAARATEVRLVKGSKLYSIILELYARAQRVARKDRAMKRAIAQFAQFLKQKKRRKPTAVARGSVKAE